jgi:hypothetical protein
MDGGTYDGHREGEAYAKMMEPFYKFLGNQMGEMLTSLGPLVNDTVMLFANSNGATMKDHHNTSGPGGTPERVPTLIFDGTGTLRTGGRYLRFNRGEKNFMDLLCAVAHAAGAPTDNFGAGGLNKVTGPLRDIMA